MIGKYERRRKRLFGIDIFTGEKHEETLLEFSDVEKPLIKRNEYTLVDIDEDGFCYLVDEQGNSKEYLKLPSDPASSEVKLTRINYNFDRWLKPSKRLSTGENIVSLCYLSC